MENINFYKRIEKISNYNLEIYTSKLLKSLALKHFEIYIDDLDPTKDYEFNYPFIKYIGSSPLEHYLINYLYYQITLGSENVINRDKIIKYLIKIGFKIDNDAFLIILNKHLEENSICIEEFNQMLKEFDTDIDNI